MQIKEEMLKRDNFNVKKNKTKQQQQQLKFRK